MLEGQRSVRAPRILFPLLVATVGIRYPCRAAGTRAGVLGTRESRKGGTYCRIFNSIIAELDKWSNPNPGKFSSLVL